MPHPGRGTILGIGKPAREDKEVQMGNAVAFFEIAGSDGDKLRRFYADLFGWRITRVPGDADYGLVAAEAPGIAGGIGRSERGVPGYATFYVEVDDPKAYLDKAEELGGKVIVPVSEVPGWDLTFALFADPEGHLVGLARGAAAVKP